MFTPIILLTILVVPYWFASAFYRDRKKSRFAGVIGLSLVFLVAGFGHFVETQPMTQLLPSWLPYQTSIIYLIGIVEFIMVFGLLNRKTRKQFGWIAIFLFIIFLPFNVYGAYSQVEFGGHVWGLNYLFLRIPLQLIFIFWAYWFCVKD